jgi:D-sedoheptulose 7-phosphate isomerase
MTQVDQSLSREGIVTSNNVISRAGSSKYQPSTYFTGLSKTLSQIDLNEINEMVALVEYKWLHGAKFVVCGNGGSAMNALHFATDLSKAVRLQTGRPFICQTLTDNIGLLTAFSNDDSYENGYAQQIPGLLSSSDVLIAISGSGNSPNIIRAVESAKSVGATTIGLCGYDGGRLRALVNHAVWVRSFDMQMCEDAHMAIGHMLVQYLCSRGRIGQS